MMKATMTLLILALAVATPALAFSTGGLALAGKTSSSDVAFGSAPTVGQQKRQKDVIVVNSSLRDIANWGDYGDMGGGYGGYGKELSRDYYYV